MLKMQLTPPPLIAVPTIPKVESCTEPEEDGRSERERGYESRVMLLRKLFLRVEQGRGRAAPLFISGCWHTRTHGVGLGTENV